MSISHLTLLSTVLCNTGQRKLTKQHASLPLFLSTSDHTPACQSERKNRNTIAFSCGVLQLRNMRCTSSVYQMTPDRYHLSAGGDDWGLNTQAPNKPFGPLATSTFLWVVLRCVVSSQPLVQYVKHLSAKINENQRESSHRHLAKTKQGLSPYACKSWCRSRRLLSSPLQIRGSLIISKALSDCSCCEFPLATNCPC